MISLLRIVLSIHENFRFILIINDEFQVIKLSITRHLVI